jgi:1,4-alpha-glucan branching enzyme
VGDKTIIFRLMDKEMYFCMNKDSQNGIVERGIALHKLIRLVTAATAGDGYLNFMGNEFGHPEWIDFPREGNGWSYKYARRQWSLADNELLRYGQLQNFDQAMVHLLRKENVLSEKPELLVADEQKKILIFMRKSCIFALNFSPGGSFADYGFSAPEGDYVQVLDSDEPGFNGFGRLSCGEHHITVPEKSPNGNQAYSHTLKLYLPARCAIVLKKV